MTQERELQIENRLTALETNLETLKELIEKRTSVLVNFVSSASGGIVVGVVLWWITKK